MQGLIIKSISGEYTIINNESNIYITKPRGLFRYTEEVPKVGDRVDFNPKTRIISNIHPRRNELNRPVIANIDKAFLIFSVKEPELNLNLLDRIIAVVEYLDIEIIIVFTKIDLLTEHKTFNEINDYYQSIGYKTYVSGYDNVPFLELENEINNNISVLAGQSGAGKSTLLNFLDPKFQLKTNVISHALGRGRHTTRHVELLPIKKGWIADTPGFGNVDFEFVDLLSLSHCFKELFTHSNKCKFNRCLHIDEPGCVIKEMVESKNILESRYQNYCLFHEELKELLKYKY